MSVESCTPAAPKVAAQGARGAHGAKGKPGVAGDAGALDAGGFSALLMQLGANDEEAAAEDLAPAAAGDVPADVVAGQDLLAKEKEGAAVDPNLLLAQSLQFQKSQPPVDERQVVQPPADERQVARALEGNTVLSGPVLNDDMPQQARSEAQAASPTPAAKSQDLVRPELSAAIKDVAAKAPASNRSTTGAAVKEAAAVQPSVVNPNAQVVAEMRLQKQAQVESRGETGAGVAQAVAAVGTSEFGVRRAERVGENMTSGRGGSGDGATGYQAMPAASGAEPSFTLTDPTAVMSPEAMVAEQVNYWIGQDVQNAELKLDGMGDSPVEVSISLQGKEARVEFRTDQLEARQVLEGAVSHLRDLLGNEGLVLSGVSVGSSGADGAASQEKRPRQGERQTSFAVPQAQPAEAGVRPGRLSGQSVDLFV